jgi:RNA polymerase sigma-70 factor (ECF subfamily)
MALAAPTTAKPDAGARPPDSRAGSSAIVMREREGDEASTINLDDVYQQHQPELVHYLQGKWQRSHEEACDIVQQAFERFMCLAEPHKVEQPRAYLFQLVRNLTVDQLRKEQVRENHRDKLQAQTQEHTGDSTLDSPERLLLNREQIESLQTVIEKLPAKRRRAFILSRVHQLSYREIADDMGISVDGVKKHVMRALETCQNFLAHRFEE